MCGLVGTVGQLDQRALTALAFLGTLSSLRGDNSLGYMDWMQSAAPNIKYLKSLELPERWFQPDGVYYNSYYHRRYKKQLPTAVAVHTRMATQGAVTKANAHPFAHKHILGMHNGTMRGSFDNRHKFETDSEAIFYNIAHEGKEFLKELQSISGAYALVWYDTKEKTLNFYRNSERPLYIMQTYTKEKGFWASDRHWLEGVLPYFEIRGGIDPLPIDTHVVIPLDVKDPLKEAQKTYISAKKFQPRHYQSHWRRSAAATVEAANENFGLGSLVHYPGMKWIRAAGRYMTEEDETKFWKLYTEASAASFKAKEKEKEKPALPLVVIKNDNIDTTKKELEVAAERWGNTDRSRIVRGKDCWYLETMAGVYVTEEFYRKILNLGCRGCAAHIPMYDDVKFLTKRDFICEECQKDQMITNMIIEEVNQEVAAGKNLNLLPAKEHEEYDSNAKEPAVLNDEIPFENGVVVH